MSNLENFNKKFLFLNKKKDNILKKYNLEDYDHQSKILLKELDNIINSINARDFLRKNINISNKYFDIIENINIIIEKIKDVLGAFTAIKIKIDTIISTIEKKYNNTEYQELLKKSKNLYSYINKKNLEYTNFLINLFEHLTKEKNKLYNVLKDFYESLYTKSLYTKKNLKHDHSQNIINFRESSNIENNQIINGSSEEINGNEVTIHFTNENNSEENEKRLSLKSLGKIEQKYYSNSNSNSDSDNSSKFFNSPHANLPQNFNNHSKPLYETHIRTGLKTKNNFSENFNNYPNSYSNGSIPDSENNPLRSKKVSVSTPNSNFSNLYSNGNSDFSKNNPLLYKTFHIKNKNLKKINELNKIIIENKKLSDTQRMLYKDKIIDIMIMTLSSKILCKYLK